MIFDLIFHCVLAKNIKPLQQINNKMRPYRVCRFSYHNVGPQPAKHIGKSGFQYYSYISYHVLKFSV
jgi:hypothetical protein